MHIRNKDVDVVVWEILGVWFSSTPREQPQQNLMDMLYY